MENAYLEGQVSTLHAEIGTDVLVDCPGEFIVQFPRDDGHYHCEERNDTWHCYQVWLNVCPNGRIRLHVVLCEQSINRLFNLVVLNRRVYHHSHVVRA